MDKANREANAHLRRCSDGSLYDIARSYPDLAGKAKLSHDQLNDILKNLRLRVCLTPQCNLKCFFCSNEGINQKSGSAKPADMNLLFKLMDMVLEHTPIRSIDISGGEPTLHPDLLRNQYRLIRWMSNQSNVRFSFHTNGLRLTPDLSDQLLKVVSRIGISLHSCKFETWNRMTNSMGAISLRHQIQNYDLLNKNINYLVDCNVGSKVFLKSVVAKGFNDKPDELMMFLNKCNELKFHPKFLEFEPQTPEQSQYIVERTVFIKHLQSLGCTFNDIDKLSEHPKHYVPATTFSYKDAPLGLHGIFRCGTPGACSSCFHFMCIFVKPTNEGSGLYLKPCAKLDTRYDITHAISSENPDHFINILRISREYLMLRPGVGLL